MNRIVMYSTVRAAQISTRFFVAAALIIASTLPLTARATVINFAPFSQPGSGFNTVGGLLVQDGFQFTSNLSSLGAWQNSSPNHPTGGTPATSLTEFFAGGQTAMTRVGGGTFDLQAIDLAGYSTAGSGPFGVTFTGTKSNGSTVQQTFNPSNAGGFTPSLQGFNLSGFTDVVSVGFTQGVNAINAYQFNNLVVDQAVAALSGGVAIANYRNDFAGTNFPSGWQYLWNPANVSIGDTANYAPAIWNEESALWTSDGGVFPPFRPLPGASLIFGPTHAHPALSPLGPELGGDNLAHYAIFAYTIDTPANGYYIGDSLLEMFNPLRTVGVDTIDLLVSVNDGPPIFAQYYLDNTTFDLALPGVSVGDTIYVAVGTNVSDNFDAFLIDFTVYGYPVPEPGSLTLMVAAIACLVGTRSWRALCREHRIIAN